MQLLGIRDSDVGGSGKVFSATLNRQSNIFKKNNFYRHNHKGCAENAPEQRRQQQLTLVFLLEEFSVRDRRGLGTGSDSELELVAERVEHSQPRGFCFSRRDLFSGRLRGCAALRGIDGHILVV